MIDEENDFEELSIEGWAATATAHIINETERLEQILDQEDEGESEEEYE